MMNQSDFKDWRCVFTPVAIELPELNARRSIHVKFARHFPIEAPVYLLESLVTRWIIDPIVSERAANADRHLWQPIVVNVETT